MAPKTGRGAAVFGAVGLMWSFELGAFLHAGCFAHDDALLPAMAVVLPIAMAFVGASLASFAWRTGSVLGGALFVLLVAMVAGATVGILWWPPDGILVGGRDGLAFGVLSLVPIGALAAALRGANARPSSVVDTADRWVAWAAAGACVAVTAIMTGPRLHPLPTCVDDGSMGVVSAAVGAGLACLSFVALVAYVARARQRLAGGPTHHPTFVDVGVGDQRAELPALLPTAYRDAFAVSTVLGDCTRAAKMLDRRARLAAALAGVATVAALVTLVTT